MKRYYILFSGIFFLSFVAVAQKTEKKDYEVNGNITGLNGDTVHMIFSSGESNYKLDTVSVKSVGDNFRFSGKVLGLTRADIYIGDIKLRKSTNIFLEPGKIKIVGDVNQISRAKVTGTQANDDLTETEKYLRPIYERRTLLYKRARQLAQNSGDLQNLQKEIKSKTDSVKAYKMRFMETHPSSEMSYGFLYVLQDEIPTAMAEQFFNSFPNKWKSSREGQVIYRKIQANKQVAIGKKAPDFTSTDPQGKNIKLSDFKGKYVLLEFWAHWCVPCREQHPHLKEIYEKFKDKGFTILQYSVDVKKDEQKWKDAIEKDGLIWSQTSDLVSVGQSPVAVLYGVQPIPDNFLISPDGTVIGRRLNPKDLQQQLEKLLNK